VAARLLEELGLGRLTGAAGREASAETAVRGAPRFRTERAKGGDVPVYGVFHDARLDERPAPSPFEPGRADRHPRREPDDASALGATA
jgi:hypothetical protein